MNIHEYQAKAVLREFGVPVPRGIPAMSVDEAVKVDEERGAVHIAKGWFQLVEVLWLPLHTHSL